MEFLVEFEVNVPDGTPESEVKNRERAEASAAAKLVDEGHLLRVWKRPVAPDETKILGLYSADSTTQLDGLLAALPLYEWMQITVTPLEPHGALAARRRHPRVRAPRLARRGADPVRHQTVDATVMTA
jgi:muconolactone D-isomerase